MALTAPTDARAPLDVEAGEQRTSQSRISKSYAIPSAFVLGMMVGMLGLFAVQHYGFDDASLTKFFSAPALPRTRFVSSASGTSVGVQVPDGQGHSLGRAWPAVVPQPVEQMSIPLRGRANPSTPKMSIVNAARYIDGKLVGDPAARLQMKELANNKVLLAEMQSMKADLHLQQEMKRITRAGRPVMQADAGEASEEITTTEAPKFNVKDMAGVTGPLGFWDPAGFTTDASENKIRFYREVELKHGRVAMLAALGFLVGEQFHPLWGGNVDVPSYIAFQETPLQPFWPAVVFAIAIPEIFSVFTFVSPFGGEPWAIRSDHYPGDLGWDPLGLKPDTEAGLKEMQTKEINNGRLAMIGAAGMIAQELASGQKLF
jgi:hypothetical protein